MKIASAVQVEKIEYGGWPNCYRVRNGSVEMIVTSDVGPRILRYSFIGDKNLFKEFPEQLGKSGEISFQARGGHRLWKAPENLATTWAADNAPVEIRPQPFGLVAIAPAEPASGLLKQMEVKLAQSHSGVTVTHRITNHAAHPLTFAPWALTMMAPGGVAIAAFPSRTPYPERLEPTNPLVMWSYTDLSDLRLTLTHKYLVLRQDQSIANPQKLGLFHENTRACYLLDGELFTKRAQAWPSETYPDFGCSFETFTNNEFLELETLGPLRTIAPGESVDHVEHWTLHRDVHLNEFTDHAIDRALPKEE